MCDYSPNREAAMTVVERDAGGKPTVWCDPCIEPFVRALNAAGLRTVASCCGHGTNAGTIALAGGKWLIIWPDSESLPQTALPVTCHPPNVENDAENGPTTWRKKPVAIEAFQITPYPGDNADAVADWCGGRVTWGGKEIASGEPQPQVYIETLEGTMKAQVGDYVIRGVQGEFYPCKPDIFLATYEQADSPIRPGMPTDRTDGGT